MKNIHKYISKAVEMVVENVVASLDKNKALVESVKFFGKEIINLENDDFKSSVIQLKAKLEENVPEFLTMNHGMNEMNNDIRKLIAHTINGVEGMNQEKRELLIRAITDYDKIVNQGKKSSTNDETEE